MANIFQSPPGTRDFYPNEMAVRRYIEDTWRKISQRHGFLEVDGPTFEFLDLYKVKGGGGDEIISQLFHFESRGEDRKEFALRPEFTPTLARMVAAKASSLPRPIKWFSIPRCYRAERPQKGRLREFIQWNVDMLGGETGDAKTQFELETVAVCVDSLKEFGLTSTDVQVNWSHREITRQLLIAGGTTDDRMPQAYAVMDKLQKIAAIHRPAFYKEMGCTDREIALFEKIASGKSITDPDFFAGEPLLDWFPDYQPKLLEVVERKQQAMRQMGMADFCRFDIGIVRGLAYYTGFVWEVADTRGQNRAVAGGGRYDKLIEMFGGPALPATGFGMGDVVVRILLEELGKLPKNPGAAVDVFVINALPSSDAATAQLAQLRQAGLTAISSYKASKNIGKLLQDASASGARLALILAPQEWERGMFKLKNLVSREEKEIPIVDFLDEVKAQLR